LDNNKYTEEFEQRQKRILDISDRILDKVSCALDEVDRTVIKVKEKEKNVEYDGDLKKPVSERYTENEKVEIIDSVIDTSSLKQIVATLKDIKDIHMGFCAKESAGETAENGIIMISDIIDGEEALQ